MSLSFDRLWVLPLLMFALLPLMFSSQRTSLIGTLSFAPADPLSDLLLWTLRLSAILAIAFVVVALSGPFLEGERIKRVGTGAQVVILLDRSGSMNDTFAGASPSGGEESKAAATKRLLKDFVGRRPHDLFGVAAFSTSPIMALPLTDHHDAVRAAINASDRPGLDFTNIARGLGMALSMFGTERADEHHVILLVSDGGAVLDTHQQDILRAEFRKFKTDLYFLFLRTAGQKGIYDKPKPDENTPQAMPERFLDLFFKTLDIPYQAYQAENPRQVEDAIADVDRLARYPITYIDRSPRRDLTVLTYLAACPFLLILIAAKLAETQLVPRHARRQSAGVAASPAA